MRLKTILNHVQKFKSFVYDKVRLVDQGGQPIIEATLQARRNSRPICSGCHHRRPGYDTLNERRFEFVPLWGIAVFFLYSPRRVDCHQCGVRVEQLPWSEGKSRLTLSYQWFLAGWAKRLSWQEVAEAFKTSWGKVFRAVSGAVDYGLKHRDLQGIESIGVDEIQFGQGHQYLTVVYQIDQGKTRLLSISQARTIKRLLRCFREIGQSHLEAIHYVCSDMWAAYLRVLNNHRLHAGGFKRYGLKVH